jgi:hypothetical protein
VWSGKKPTGPIRKDEPEAGLNISCQHKPMKRIGKKALSDLQTVTFSRLKNATKIAAIRTPGPRYFVKSGYSSYGDKV